MLVATALSVEWRDPSLSPPPQGSKILILTEYGVAILGVWRDNSGFIAWASLPLIPPHIKEKLL